MSMKPIKPIMFNKKPITNENFERLSKRRKVWETTDDDTIEQHYKENINLHSPKYSQSYMDGKIDEDFDSYGVDIKEPSFSKEQLQKSFPMMTVMTNDDWRQNKQTMTLLGEENFLKSLRLYYKSQFDVEPLKMEVV